VSELHDTFLLRLVICLKKTEYDWVHSRRHLFKCRCGELSLLQKLILVAFDRIGLQWFLPFWLHECNRWALSKTNRFRAKCYTYLVKLAICASNWFSSQSDDLLQCVSRVHQCNLAFDVSLVAAHLFFTICDIFVFSVQLAVSNISIHTFCTYAFSCCIVCSIGLFEKVEYMMTYEVN